MPLVVNRLQENLVSRGLGGSSLGELGPCQEIIIPIECNVTTEEEFYPLTGTPAGVSGWRWNKTIPQDLDVVSKRIENTIGGYFYNLEEGAVNSDWQGSVVFGLDLNEIEEKSKKQILPNWMPKISKGTYTINEKEKALLGSASGSLILTSSSIALDENVLENSVSINLFKRDVNYNNIPIYQYFNKEFFVDNNYFYIENMNLFLNELKQIKVGSVSTERDAVLCHYENKGVSDSNRSLVYSNYFPVINLNVVTILNNRAIENWLEVDSFVNSSPVNKHYILDAESGKITFPKKASETKYYLKEDLGNKLVFFQSLENLPEEGYVIFGEESIRYYTKSKYSLLVDQTREAFFQEGDFAIEKQMGRFLNGETLYISYTATPRLDFEYKNEAFISDLNLKPYSTLNSNGILQIDIDEVNVKRIELISDKPNIISNIYGELYIGTDVTNITATVYNGNDKPVEEITVDFLAEEGSFNNGGKRYFDVTNQEGQASVGYHYDYNDTALSLYSNPSQLLNESYFEIGNMPPGITTGDITLFQIMKTDPLRGSLGYLANIQNVVINEDIVLTLENNLLNEDDYKTIYEPEYGLGTIVNQSLCPETQYNYALAILYFDNGLVSAKTTIKSLNEKTLILNKANLESYTSQYGTPTKVRLFKRSELKFSLQDVQAGAPAFERLVYRYNDDEEIYKPLKPTRIAGNRVYYDALLPVGSNSEENIVAGYKIYCPQLISLFAETINPGNGALIRSNELKLKVNFPNYLRTERGFRFFEESNSDGSGLGGINFLSVNPEVNNQLNVMLF